MVEITHKRKITETNTSKVVTLPTDVVSWWEYKNRRPITHVEFTQDTNTGEVKLKPVFD